jgi:hypothetical protein
MGRSLNQPSSKTFLNVNGTLSKAGNKAKLQYNMRDAAIDADMIPGLAYKQLADANYVMNITPEEVQVFDAEIEPF